MAIVPRGPLPNKPVDLSKRPLDRFGRQFFALRPRYRHEVVDHASVRGEIHMNGIENFWALFKRCLKGTYIRVLPCHLNAYLAEESFRFNERRGNDAERFALRVAGVSRRRLTYQSLIGKVGA